MRARLAVVAAAATLAACAPHIAPYRPKHRELEVGTYDPAFTPSGASLWTGGGGLYGDDRAGRLGDIVTIVIDENDSASRGDTTSLKKTSKSQHAVPASLGLLPALAAKFPGLDPNALFGVDNDSSFDGAGEIKREGRVRATLPVRVRKVLPNGDLFVEGQKVILVGSEEQHLYLSGIVRRADVRADNTVPSSRVAEAEIETSGRGDVSDQQRQGWLTRTMSKIWPF